jgi:hypothetical protein
MAEAHAGELAVFARAKAVLTDAQRATVEQQAEEHGRHQGAREKHDGH